MFPSWSCLFYYVHWMEAIQSPLFLLDFIFYSEYLWTVYCLCLSFCEDRLCHLYLKYLSIFGHQILCGAEP